MVIDTSALVAILCDETDAPLFEAAIERDPTRLISAATLLEISIVIEARFGEDGGRELDLLIHKAQIEIAPFDQEQAEIAREAYRTYGRGRNSAAQLRRLFRIRAQHRSRRTAPLQGRRFREDRY